MEILGFTYAAVAVGVSVLAAVAGLVYSVVDAVLKSKRDGKAQWQPLPFALGFAIFWPAFLFLFPFFVFDNVLARAVRAERPWAVHLSEEPWYKLTGRLVLGIGVGIMGCYVAGFFI